MKKIMIYPGAFDPFHLYHMIGTLYFGHEYGMDKVIILPSYRHEEKNTLDFGKRKEIIEAWLDELPLHKERVRSWIENCPYLPRKPAFAMVVANNGEGYKNTGSRIAEIMDSYTMKEYYLLMGYDAFLKFDKFCDYEKILEKSNIIINNYDRETFRLETDEEEGKITARWNSGSVALPLVGKSKKRPKKLIFDQNPATGLHSAYIREEPERYLHLFPPKVKKLIRKYYME